MKAFFASFVAAISLSTAPILTQPALAQGETQIDALQDMAAWMQDMLAIQTDLMSLFNTEMMQDMYQLMQSEDIEGIARFGERFEAERQVVLARSRAQMEALPKPEKWNIDPRFFSREETAIHRAASQQYEGMWDTYREYDKMSSSFADMLINLDTIDEAALSELQRIQIESSVKMIEIENRQIDGYLVALPPDNPNYQFQSIVKQVNLASIPEIRFGVTTDDDLKTRQRMGRKMQAELAPISGLIQKGRANAAKQMGILRNLPDAQMTAQEKLFMPKLIQMYESFDRTFDIEQQMYDAMMNSARLYMSDDPLELITDSINENDLSYFGLVDQRVELLNYRVALVQ